MCSIRDEMYCVKCRGTWAELISPSVSLATFSQLLMWRIGGWVEGQVLPPPFTSDLLMVSFMMTLASYLFLSQPLNTNYFGLLCNYFWLLLSFMIFSLIPKALNLIFVWWKMFFLLWKNILPSVPFIPLFCHRISSTALCMAFSYLCQSFYRLNDH